MRGDSIDIALDRAGHTLHLKRIRQREDGIPVLMIHGSIENGRIFYSKDLTKGFAPYMARHGYDVYVADLQGRGQSRPRMSRSSTYGQTDVIHTDIPACMDAIRDLRGDVPVHWVSHSWGGVLMLSHLARYDVNVISQVHFAVKRRITARSWAYYDMLWVRWHLMGRLFNLLYGYLPADRFGFGADGEPREHFRQVSAWLGPTSRWVDNVDGYDYGAAARSMVLPPALYLAGVDDPVLGNPRDVHLLMEETGQDNATFRLLGQEHGNRVDYGHNDILTHPLAVDDHFPEVLDWMRGWE